MHVTFVVLAILLAVAFLMAALPKLLKQRQMVDSAEHLGFSVKTYQLIGLLELAAVVGLVVGAFVWAPLGVAAAVGLVALLVGAVVSHKRAGDNLAKVAVYPMLLAVLSVVTVVLGIATLA